MISGNAFAIHCGNCGLQNSEVVMECDCIDARTGDTTTSSIDLSELHRHMLLSETVTDLS